MRVLFACMAVLLLLLEGTRAGAQADAMAHDVLLDNSGSMKGFGNDPVWPDLLARLQNNSGRRWVFDNKLDPFDGNLAGAALSSGKTDLGEAVTSWVRQSPSGAAAFIITDNVADSGDQAAMASQEKWERELQSGRIAHLVLIPLRLPFRGSLYSPSNLDLRTLDYSGPRALALYVVVKASSDRTATLAAVRSMEERAKAVLDHLKTRQIQSVWLTITPFGVSGKTEDAVERNDIVLTPDNTSQATAAFEKDVLVVRNLTAGDSASFQFFADVKAGENFRLNNAEVDADITFDGHPTLQTEKLVTADVDPKKADLDHNARRFSIKFNIKPFRWTNLSKWDMLKLALSNETAVNGNLHVSYEVDRGQVDLAKSLTDAWSFDGSPLQLHLGDTTIQSRLYRLTEMVRQSVRNDALKQVALTIPVVMHVRYPLRPIAVAIVFGAIGLAGLIYVLAQMGRPRPFVGSNDINQEQMLTPSLLTPAYMVSSDGQCQVTVRWLLIGILVGTNGRLGSPRLLPAGGGAIEVTLPDSGIGGGFYSFRLEQRADAVSDFDAEYN